MLTLSPETEAIIQAKVAITGRSPDEVLRDALGPAGKVLPWRNKGAYLPATMTREELIERMEEIAIRSAGRPTADPRSPDEIIGYDDFGLPR